MLVKIHNAYRTTISICDSGLIGKKFVEGNYQLDLTGRFFAGEEKSPFQLKKIIQRGLVEDATFNIVGKESCDFAKKIGLISNKGTLTIKGVPVALILI